ncbi:MAG: hypothetical protein JW940_11655 [Polyangiaceae bacterium]|nr:hypothetical protein [Polyangiaceae bacterium]
MTYTGVLTVPGVESPPNGTLPLYDDNGVDLTLVRKMLRLPPEERLRYVQELVEEILTIWELNGTRPIR